MMMAMCCKGSLFIDVSYFNSYHFINLKYLTKNSTDICHFFTFIIQFDLGFFSYSFIYLFCFIYFIVSGSNFWFIWKRRSDWWFGKSVFGSAYYDWPINEEVTNVKDSSTAIGNAQTKFKIPSKLPHIDLYWTFISISEVYVGFW